MLDKEAHHRHNAPSPHRPRLVNGAPMVGSAARVSGFPGDVMPKMKTKRCAAKRFSFTGTGKVRRSKSGLNHMMQEKSRKRLRRLRKNDTVDKAFQKRVKIMLPYG